MAVRGKYPAPGSADNRRERTTAEKILRVMIVLVLLTLIGLAGYSQYVGITLLPESAVSTVVTPVQGVFSRVVASVSSYVQRVKLRSNIEYEYNQLKAQNDQLMYDSLRNDELENEVVRLKAMLGVFEESSQNEMNPILATVVARETGNWFSTFDIDKGTNHGVYTDMAVITPDGHVGRVYEVNPTSAKVISIIDSNSNIAGLVESSRDQGIVRGSLGIDGQPLCRMYYLPTDNVPRPGDKVVTSGVGTAFPKGLVIGTVRESTRAIEEGKYYIVVEPQADFQHIEEVLVLRYVPAVEEMPEGMYDDTQIEIQALPPAPSAAVVVESELNATPEPLPGAPGRATVEPAETPVPTPTLHPDAALLDPDSGLVPTLDPKATPSATGGALTDEEAAARQQLPG